MMRYLFIGFLWAVAAPTIGGCDRQSVRDRSGPVSASSRNQAARPAVSEVAAAATGGIGDESVVRTGAHDVPPLDEVPASESATDEPRYRTVPLSMCIDELKLGTFDDFLGDSTVSDRPPYADRAFRHFGSLAVPALRKALEDESVVVRCNALQALQEIGPEAKDAVTACVAVALRDKNPTIRRLALQTLGRIGLEAEAAIPALEKLLHDTERHAVPPHGFWRISTVARETLVAVGPASIPIFTREMHDQDPIVRIECAAGLSGFRTQHALIVPLLRDLLKDDEPVVRATAAEALGAFGADAQAVAGELAALLNDKATYGIGILYSGTVGVAAAKALGAIGPTAAEVPALIAVLRGHVPAASETHPDPTVWSWDETIQCDAAEALARLGPEAQSAVDALSEALRRKPVRCAAAAALVRIDPARPEALAVLQECLSEESRLSQLRALRAFGGGVVPDNAGLDRLRRLARSSEGHVCALAAAIILKSVPDDMEMRRTLKGELSDGQSEVWYRLDDGHAEFLDMLATVRAAAEAAVPGAVKNLRDPWKNSTAIDVLERTGPLAAPAVNEILDLLESPDDTELRRSAATALGRIGPVALEAIPALRHSLGDPRATVRAAAADSLGRLGIADEKVLAALSSSLEDEYIIVRLSAVRALGRLGAAAQSAIEAVSRLADDASLAVRDAASDASQRIRTSAHRNGQ